MITACVITLNEAAHIARCLAALAWCDEIVVVDGGSTDATVAMARQYTSSVFVRPFDDFSSQRNFAIRMARHPWVLMVDVDEVVTPTLARHIQLTLRAASPNMSAYTVERITQLFGHWCVSQHAWIARVLRRGHVRYVGMVHECPVIDGDHGQILGILEHYSTSTIAAWMAKARRYLPLELAERRRRGDRFSWRDVVRPWARFVRDYLWRGGWRDGWAGFLFHVLSVYYDLLIAVGMWQDRRHRA